MRSSGNARASMLAAMDLAMLAASDVMPAPRKGGNRDYTPRRVEPLPPDGTLAREIAEHNAAVDRRKAEKKAAKLMRRVA